MEVNIGDGIGDEIVYASNSPINNFVNLSSLVKLNKLRSHSYLCKVTLALCKCAEKNIPDTYLSFISVCSACSYLQKVHNFVILFQIARYTVKKI